MKTISPLVLAVLLTSPLLNASPVNINAANADLLAKSLHGIGLHKARAIVDYRQRHGKFHQPVDIVSVKGIGKATYNRNRRDISVK